MRPPRENRSPSPPEPVQGGAHCARLRTAACVLALGFASCIPASAGARLPAQPLRNPILLPADLHHKPVSFVSDGLTLRGWWFPTPEARRGVAIYLHGVSINRSEAIFAVRH